MVKGNLRSFSHSQRMGSVRLGSVLLSLVPSNVMIDRSLESNRKKDLSFGHMMIEKVYHLNVTI